MTLTNEQLGDVLKRVIAAIDKWWVEVTNLKKGAFYRYDLRGSSNLNLKSYIEWRYKSGAFEKDYMSLVISLAPARGDTVSIDLNLQKMENGVYTDYDPFCWFQNNNYGVSIDAETGFDKNSMIWDFITINDINHLIDRIYSIITEEDETAVSNNNEEIKTKEMSEDMRYLTQTTRVFRPTLAGLCIHVHAPNLDVVKHAKTRASLNLYDDFNKGSNEYSFNGVITAVTSNGFTIEGQHAHGSFNINIQDVISGLIQLRLLSLAKEDDIKLVNDIDKEEN